MKNNLLTVNVITYNHKPYIAKCLDSLLEQKTDFGFIIRVFDDCSTDGTTEICREYAEKYPNKIQFFPAEKNLGAKLNSLRSYLDINTPYYLYIEGDDYRIDKKGFQKQINFLNKNPECVFCAAKCINLYNGTFRDSHPNLATGVYTSEEIRSDYKRYYIPNLGTRIVRTECIRLDKYPEDYLWDLSQFFELIDMGKMGFISEEYMVYQMTGSGVFSGKNSIAMLNYITSRGGEYNNRNNKYILNFLFIIKIELDGAVFREEEKIAKQLSKDIEHRKSNTNNRLKKIKAVIHLFVPAIFSIAIHNVRDFFRHIREALNE